MEAAAHDEYNLDETVAWCDTIVDTRNVIGDRELETNTVAVRTRSGEDLGAMSIDEVANRFSLEIASRGHTALLEE